MVVRFTQAEFDTVRDRAGLAGLSVGAWIGVSVLASANPAEYVVGLPDLLRLHADVAAMRLGSVGEGERARLDELLTRLDAAVDIVVGLTASPRPPGTSRGRS